MTNSKETFAFQTEARQLLDLMIHSVYSNRDVFLRELVSNASDALDKLRLESLTDESLANLVDDLHIRIEPDSEARTLTISDNGIGMSRDDLNEFIGTIAKSGTREYMRILREKGETSLPEEMIGQFGIGFYSAFMVADSVSLVTRRAGDDKAWKWESSGDGTYTLEEAARESQGTSITIHLKKEDAEDAKNYAEAHVISEIIRRYSDFVSWPIRMKNDKGEDETLNSMKALWTREESDVTDEEYTEFYKHLTHDWNPPLERVLYRAEGAQEFRALLYIPSKAPLDLFIRDMARGIHLYIRRVFVMDECRELIPEYMRFVRGLVDSEDLPLNVSREMLQQNRQVDIIRRSVTRKTLDALENMLTNDRESFKSFWTEFGKVLKEGIFSDSANKDKILGTCLFGSTGSDEPVTLKEYMTRMPDDQKAVYYVTAPSVTVAKNSPHLEAFLAKGYEVLLLTDPVDELWSAQVTEYEGKPFRSVSRGEADLDSPEEKKDEAAEQEKAGRFGKLVEDLKKALDEKVKEVRLSSRLTSSPSCLVGEDFDMTPQMEELLRATGQDVPKVKRILELNPDHPLVDRLEKIHGKSPQDPDVARYGDVLFGLAMLAEGGRLEDPAAFSREVAELLS